MSNNFMGWQIVNSATGPEKRRWDPIMTAIIFRPVGMAAAALLLKTNVSADAVSFFGVAALYAAIVAAFLVPPEIILVTLGVGMFIFAICDVVDGALARARGKLSRLGAWVDGITGYIAIVGFYLGWLIVLDHEGLKFLSIMLIVLSLGANLLLRLLYSTSKPFIGEIKLVGDEGDIDRSTKKKLRALFFLLDSNLGVTGFFLLFVLLSAIQTVSIIISVAYAVIYGTCFVVSLFYFYRVNAASDFVQG